MSDVEGWGFVWGSTMHFRVGVFAFAFRSRLVLNLRQQVIRTVGVLNPTQR